MQEVPEEPVKTKNDQAITQAIARDTDTSLEVVQAIYESEMSALAGEAKITQFIGVIASRRVRMRLRSH